MTDGGKQATLLFPITAGASPQDCAVREFLSINHETTAQSEPPEIAMPAPRMLLSAEDIERSLQTLARSILERRDPEPALIGIQRRGVDLARRLREILAQNGLDAPLGTLDITLYRDDWTVKGAKPVVGRTHIPFAVEGKTLILVDDVLYTGRTIRAALEALTDFGRPGKVELLVLVDRGLRELPIHADYVGLSAETTPAQRVDVLLRERDDRDEVLLVEA